MSRKLFMSKSIWQNFNLKNKKKWWIIYQMYFLRKHEWKFQICIYNSIWRQFLSKITLKINETSEYFKNIKIKITFWQTNFLKFTFLLVFKFSVFLFLFKKGLIQEPLKISWHRAFSRLATPLDRYKCFKLC